MRGVNGAPLNHSRQRAIEQPLAVITHRDLPGQQAVRRHAGRLQQRATVDALHCQSYNTACGLRHVGHKVDQPWPGAGQGALQTGIIKVKPTPTAICTVFRCF